MDGSNRAKFEVSFRYLPRNTKKDRLLTINQTPSLNPGTSEYGGKGKGKVIPLQASCGPESG